MSRTTLGALVAVVALVAVGGIAIAQDATRSAKIPDDLQIPRSASKRANPQGPTPQNLAEGKKYYASQCAMCHGDDGRGGGDLAKSLKMDVPDFTDPVDGPKRSDGDLFYILTNGHGDMPGEGEDRLSETVRWNMITYVRSLEGAG